MTKTERKEPAMAPFTITMRATFDKVRWTDDDDGDPEPEPEEWGGWVDPRNPWGSFEQDADDDSIEPESVTFETLWEAARFVADFPGAVWNYMFDCESELDRDGTWKRVTLHVDDHAATVFELADLLR